MSAPKLNFRMLALFIFTTQAAGVVGSIFTLRAIPTWYAFLEKPSFAPPDWIFAPVWLALYFLMGLSGYLIWEKGFSKPEVRLALTAFAVQLILNVCWSFAFFGLLSPLTGLIVIGCLLVSILIMIRLFYSINARAAYLLTPYLIWVSFAAVLNYAIWLMNMK